MSHKIKHSKDTIIFNIIAHSFLIIAAFLCIVPFITVLSGSFTSEQALVKEGLGLLPKDFTLEAYKMIFMAPAQMLRAYGVTIFITFFGGISTLFLISMTAYVLSRPDFMLKKSVSFYIYFTTLFSGGLVPWYILIMKYLDLKDNILALILPMLFNVFYIIVIRSFMSSLPYSITESAQLDGAGDFTIFLRLIMPLSKPVLAAMGLFIALGYWNDWFNAMLFIEDRKMMPLQYFLHDLIASTQALRNMRNQLPPGALISNPNETLKMAMTVITIGPIMFLYPFLQKYFVKGIMVGSVKG